MDDGKEAPEGDDLPDSVKNAQQERVAAVAEAAAEIAAAEKAVNAELQKAVEDEDEAAFKEEVRAEQQAIKLATAAALKKIADDEALEVCASRASPCLVHHLCACVYL